MGTTLRVTRIVVAAVPAAMALVVVRAGLDVFTTSKATVAVVAALAVVAVAVRAWTHATLPAPPRTFATVAAALGVVLAVAALAAPSPPRALVGEPGRHSGLAVWLAALILAVAAAALARRDGGRPVALAMVAASLPVSAYAIVQASGLDPLPWQAVEGGPQVFATLGNADYLSAWLGMVLPLALAVVTDATTSTGWRVGAGAAGLMGWVAALQSGSLQGPVAGLAGSIVVLVSLSAVPRWRRTRLAGLGLTVLFAAAAAAGLVAVTGSPGAVVASVERSVETRLPSWRGAVSMAAANPLTGVGPGHFGDEWFVHRPPAAVVAPDADEKPVPGGRLGRPVDDAHAVPLHVAATAGWPAALLWVGALAVAIAHGVRALAAGGVPRSPRSPGAGRGTAQWMPATAAGSRRPPPAGLLGAALAAVIVQTVSVDVAPVTVTAWIVVGALAGAACRERGSGPGPVLAAPTSGRAARTLRQVATGAVVAVSVLAVLPLAADIVAGRAAAADSAAQRAVADRRWRVASRLAPWERRYPSRRAERLAASGRFRGALNAQAEARRRAPRDRAAAIDHARLTAVVAGPRPAVDVYEDVLDIDPSTAALAAEAATNALRAGRTDRAVALLRRAVELAPDVDLYADMLRTVVDAPGEDVPDAALPRGPALSTG